jgi:hyperosmotically inducible periplasmic protein
LKNKQVLILSLALVLTAVGGCASSGQSRSTGEVMDDTSIAARTKTALLADPVTDGLNIDVEVDRSRVQLNGFVDSQEQIDRAGEIAKDISGVASVENNLRVSDGGDRMAGEYVDDKALQARVKAALANDPAVQSLRVDVEVNRGEVSLGGYVDSAEERDAAVAAARKVSGVTKVVNNLAVRGTAAR